MQLQWEQTYCCKVHNRRKRGRCASIPIPTNLHMSLLVAPKDVTNSSEWGSSSESARGFTTDRKPEKFLSLSLWNLCRYTRTRIRSWQASDACIWEPTIYCEAHLRWFGKRPCKRKLKSSRKIRCGHLPTFHPVTSLLVWIRLFILTKIWSFGNPRNNELRHYLRAKFNTVVKKFVERSVTTLNFHILRVANNVSYSSIMWKYNSYMSIIYNLNFEKRFKQLNLWKTQSWSYVFKYKILKFRENKKKYKII